ncbi:hypothetical protein [Salipiger sp.]|uniref:hypothetical protein n=1 Tax=Salipiger sp. TaxID=2078585 RepID=UPI003A96C904
MMKDTADADGLETHRSYIPKWEINSEGIWDARFVARVFQHASDTLREAVAPGVAARHVHRRLRFIAPMFGGEPVRIGSARLRSGDDVVHLLSQARTGNLCAVALDRVGYDISGLPVVDTPEAAPSPFADDEEIGTDGTVTHLSVLRPAAFDHLGVLLSDAVCACVVEAMPHILVARGAGAAPAPITELHVSLTGEGRSGDVARLVSQGDPGRIRHVLDCPTSGRVYARAVTVHTSAS